MTQDLKRRLYAYFANKPNKTNEEEDLMTEVRCELPYYEITSVSRDDLVDCDFDISNIPDNVMERIASKMSDAYIENGFWIDLDIIAENEGVPKKRK